MKKLLYFRTSTTVEGDDQITDSVAIPASIITGIMPGADTSINVRYPNLEYNDIHVSSAISTGEAAFAVDTANTTSGSATVTMDSQAVLPQTNMRVINGTGTGIPDNTFVGAVASATSFSLVDINGTAVLATANGSDVTLTFNSNLANPMVRTDIERFGNAFCVIQIQSGRHREVLEDVMGALSGNNPFVVIGDDTTKEYISKYITGIGSINVNYDPDGLDVAEGATSSTLLTKPSHSTGA